MQVFHTVKGLREVLNQDRRNGQTIGFVPTMGNLMMATWLLSNRLRRLMTWSFVQSL